MAESEQAFADRLLALIKARRSIRAHTETPIADEVLDRLLEAARWAPTGGNKQQWCFLLVREPLTIRKIAAVSPGLLGKPQALVVLCADRGKENDRAVALDEACSLIESGMAAQNLMLLAAAHGLGSCPIRSFNPEALRRLLALPAQVEPELIVTLGYPARAVAAPARRAWSEIVHFERYGARVAEGRGDG